MIKTNVCLNMEDFEQCQESILSWNTTDPRFQECIEKSVISWTPCVLLLLGTPLHVLTLNNDTKPTVLKNIQKVITLFIAVITLCNIGLILMDIVNGDIVPTSVVLSPIIIILSLGTCLECRRSFDLSIFPIVTAIYNDNRRQQQRKMKTNTFLNITWILLFFAISLRLYLHDSTHNSFFKNGITDSLNFTTLCLYFVLVLCRVIKSAFTETLVEDEKDFKDQTSPESKASLLSFVTFNWIGPLILKKQYIERKDLWPLRKGNTATSITHHFEKYWNQQLDYTQRIKPEVKLKREEQTKNTQQGNLCICLLKTYGPILFLSTIYKLMFHAADFMYPIVLRALILLATDKSGDNSFGYLYSFLLLSAILGKSIFGPNHQQKTHEAMMRSWTALTIAIYKKTLKLSSSAKKLTTVGEITNLMSSDANKIGECMWSISDVITHPLVFCISFYYLWQILGPSILVGIIIMILLIPLNLKLMKKSKALHLKHSSLRDSRIKMMNEVLNGIQAIKMYAWEKSFEKQISDIRNKELGVKKENMRTGAYMWTAFNISPFMISLGTFATYVLLDPNNVLTADKAFVSMSYFHMINWSMTVLPNCITNFVQANVSLKRIQNYLNSEELEEEFINRNVDSSKQVLDRYISTQSGVFVENGTFTWDRTTEATITDININIPEGSLVAIVGSVGSGKSSLLSALLGEMECVTGKANIKGSVAYVAQQTWIMNETLQKNILFGEDLIQKKYNRIIGATALRSDLEILPGGDKTEIGEKGINLSGGQKQRVSLARAVYQDADVYLLDDPLSAVDSHVGKHIFEEVIGPNGLLRNKTRILVTHGVSFLPTVDKIITVIDGRIGEIGSFRELLERNGAFAEFLKSYLIDELGCGNSKEEIEALVMTEEFVSQINNKDKSETLKRQLSEISDKPEIKSQMKKKKSLESSSERAEFDQSTTPKGNRLIQDETVQVGRVKFEVFVTYAKAVGLQTTLLIVVFIIINKLVQLSSDVWLSKWTNDNAIIANETNKDELTHRRLGIYALHGLFQGVAVFGSECVLHIAIYKTASRLHLDMLKNILRLPMIFFETTPVGRILNRFTKDIQTVDDVLLQNFRNAIQFVIFAVFNVLVVCAGSPRSVFPIVPILMFYIYIQRLFVKVSRQLRRLESAARSPIFSHFHETISGTSTIRAYQQQNRFISEISHRCDEVNTCHHILITSERWLNLRLSSLGGLVVFCASLFAISNMDDISPGQIGLTMMYAQSIVGILHRLVYMTNEAENNTVAVERIKEYTETSTEAQWVIPEKKPKKTWPSEGCVEFRDYGVRYREGLDLVLKGITCTLNPREKIGIVGRTGAGKSSLTRGLLRIIEPAAGSVIVDGIDISTIGLHDLRSNITIIPQDPVLFSGTIRMNLDPFEEFPKGELWQALEHAHLKTFVNGLDGGLDYQCSEGGENLSVGQRQLVCLARALLRKTKILVLDEATAAVDLETDELIQNTIRREFDDCTILTIAHRLNTIIDYTRILVLDAGVIKEFDTPTNLLKDTTSMFYGMTKDAGLHIP